MGGDGLPNNEEKINIMETRISTLETEVKVLATKYDDLKESLGEIKSGIRQVQGTLITAIILAVLGLVLKQGIQL